MDKRIIRTWLLNKKPRVYTVIVSTYYAHLSSLKTSLFVDWLAVELDVKPELINISSISSDLRRYRIQLRKNARGNINSKNILPEHDPFNTEIPDSISFR